MIQRTETYGPTAGQTPHVYFHCETEDEAWARFDRFMAKPQNRAQYRGRTVRLVRRTATGWERVER